MLHRPKEDTSIYVGIKVKTETSSETEYLSWFSSTCSSHLLPKKVFSLFFKRKHLSRDAGQGWLVADKDKERVYTVLFPEVLMQWKWSREVKV